MKKKCLKSQVSSWPWRCDVCFCSYIDVIVCGNHGYVLLYLYIICIYFVKDVTSSIIKDTISTPTPEALKVGSVFEGDVPTATATMGDSTEVEIKEDEDEDGSPVRTKEERKLAIMTMHKKRKRLFDQIMKSRKKKMKEVNELKRKRKEYDNSLQDDSSKRIKT